VFRQGRLVEVNLVEKVFIVLFKSVYCFFLVENQVLLADRKVFFVGFLFVVGLFFLFVVEKFFVERQCCWRIERF